MYIIINVEKVITKVLLLRRNFDHRSWTRKSAKKKNSDSKFDISDEAHRPRDRVHRKR